MACVAADVLLTRNRDYHDTVIGKKDISVGVVRTKLVLSEIYFSFYQDMSAKSDCY